MFEIENQFYRENRETIREKYKGKAVVIVGETVVEAYDSMGEAYKKFMMLPK